jgi:hypothetical protein
MGGVLRDGRPELSLSLQTRHPNSLRPLPLILAFGASGGAPLPVPCSDPCPVHGFAPRIEARQGQDANQLARGRLGS